MKRCDVCGKALDGHVFKPHVIGLYLDGSPEYGHVYCVQHFEEVRARLLLQFAQVLDAHITLEEMRGVGV